MDSNIIHALIPQSGFVGRLVLTSSPLDNSKSDNP
jgi:hypothetical protein